MSKNNETGEFEEDFTPKTANRKINKPVMIAVAIAVLLAGLGIGGYFIYEGINYYQTDNAKVDTSIFQLTPKTNGDLRKVYVSLGEQVEAGQVLARVENGSYIRSPIDGTVIDIDMNEGDYVTTSDVIMVIAQTSDMYITANVEETNILKIREGQKVIVTLDAYGQTFEGYVDRIDSITSTKLSGSTTSFTTSGTYTKVTQLIPVRIRLNGNVYLANIIGTNANVKIKLK